MFDMGFMEMGLIGVIALMVIGPERLPAVARTVGQWVGKARRFVSYVQSDIKDELNKADELKRLLEEQSKIKDIHEILENTVDESTQRVAVGTPLSSHTTKSFDDPSQPSDQAQPSTTADNSTQAITKSGQ